jgi:hypothetical protein
MPFTLHRTAPSRPSASRASSASWVPWARRAPWVSWVPRARRRAQPGMAEGVRWAAPPRTGAGVSLRALLRGRRRDHRPTRLARAAWLSAGLLPLAGCTSSFLIGASKGTTVFPGTSYQGGFEAGWRNVLNQPAYFTWCSNAVVAATSLTLAGARQAPRSDLFWAVRAAGLGSVMVTGLVYNTVLRGHGQDTLLYRANDAVQHVLSPLLAPIVWGAFDPRGQLNRRRRLLAAALPLTWAGVTMARGPRVDWYPYPFLDVKRYGTVRVSGVLAGIFTVFSGMLLGLTGADRLIAGRHGRR